MANKDFIKQLIGELGGDQAVAEERRIKAAAVRMWIVNGEIPAKHHYAIIQLARERTGRTLTLEQLIA